MTRIHNTVTQEEYTPPAVSYQYPDGFRFDVADYLRLRTDMNGYIKRGQCIPPSSIVLCTGGALVEAMYTVRTADNCVLLFHIHQDSAGFAIDFRIVAKIIGENKVSKLIHILKYLSKLGRIEFTFAKMEIAFP